MTNEEKKLVVLLERSMYVDNNETQGGVHCELRRDGDSYVIVDFGIGNEDGSEIARGTLKELWQAELDGVIAEMTKGLKPVPRLERSVSKVPSNPARSLKSIAAEQKARWAKIKAAKAGK